MSGNFPVKASRIAEDIDALARLAERDLPWTRRVFSPLFGVSCIGQPRHDRVDARVVADEAFPAQAMGPIQRSSD
jgi:hypothetical protein